MMCDVSMTHVELLVLEALLEVVLLALEAHDERVQLVRAALQLGAVGAVDVERRDALLENGLFLRLQLLLRLLGRARRLVRHHRLMTQTQSTDMLRTYAHDILYGHCDTHHVMTTYREDHTQTARLLVYTSPRNMTS